MIMKKVFAAVLAALIGLFAGFASAAEPQVMLNWSPTFDEGAESMEFTTISIYNTSLPGQSLFDNKVFSRDHLEDPLEVSSAIFDEKLVSSSYFFFELYNDSLLTGRTGLYTYVEFMNAVSVWGSSYQPSLASDYLEVTIHMIPEPSSGMLLLLGSALLGLKRKRREENTRRTARSSRRTSWRRASQLAVLCGLLLSVPSSVWAGSQTSSLNYTVGTVVEVEAPSNVSSNNHSGWTVESNSRQDVAVITVVYGTKESTQKPKVQIEAIAPGTTECVISTKSSNKTWTINVTVTDSPTPPPVDPDEPDEPDDPDEP